jgi:hypothetical protein
MSVRSHPRRRLFAGPALAASIAVAAPALADSIRANASIGAGGAVTSISGPADRVEGGAAVHDFGATAGDPTANLTVNSVASRMDYALAGDMAGTLSDVTLSHVVGAAGAAGRLAITQNGGGVDLALMVKGGTFARGGARPGSAGVVINQASTNAVTDVAHTAAANGYAITVSR